MVRRSILISCTMAIVALMDIPVRALEILVEEQHPALAESKSSQKSEADLDATGLYWMNGDVLEGQPLSADGKTLTWKSDLFTNPLQINMHALKQIRFQ